MGRMADVTTAPEADLEHLPAGTRVGEYVIDQPIGVGGFARVYRARHPVLATRVAVKVITRALALDAEATQRFVREAQAASRIAHPGIVRVLGYGQLRDGRAYQVMELIEGPALDHHLAQVGRLPLDESLRILDAIAAALDAAHAAGIIHRDLKPANVLLAAAAGGPSPRLADFGIAKALETESATPHLTRTGTTLGTPAYMSPEQALGRTVATASDVYAFGVVAYELITGRVPFQGETPFETMMMHVQAPPPPPSQIRPELGERFDAAMASLLAKHPDQRPAGLAEAMTMLRREPAAPSRATRRAPVALAAVVVMASAVGGYVWWSRGPVPAAVPIAAPAAAASPASAAAPPIAAPPIAAPLAPTDPAPPPADLTRGSVAAPPSAEVVRSRPSAPARQRPAAGAASPARRASPPAPPADQLERPPDYQP